MATPDVLIVGGGVVGAACARALAKRNVSVHLIESGPEPGAASIAAAGMLAPIAEAGPEDPLLGFGVRARDYYGELAPELREETGVDLALWLDGIFEVAFSPEALEKVRAAAAWQRQAGFAVDLLTAEELRQRIPGIGPEALGAALAPEDGALDPVALHQGLLNAAVRLGATVSRGERALEVLAEGGRAKGVRTPNGILEAEQVLVAAGAWSGRLSGLPWALPVEPMRGQMAAAPWLDREPRAVIYGGGGYVLERGGELIAGSTMERAGFHPVTTEAGLAHLYGVMQRIFPAADPSRVTRTWAGLRPVTPDGRPIMGPDPEVPNLWYATGHGRNGILLAGITGEVMAQLVAGEGIELDLAPFSVARFRAG
jgi:glycine oxidase